MVPQEVTATPALVLSGGNRKLLSPPDPNNSLGGLKV